MGDKKNTVLLDADDSSLKNRLLLSESSSDGFPEDLESLLPFLGGNDSKKGEVPWKWVTPTPGLCVKTHTEEGGKVFINICHTPEIPDPLNWDEETLQKIYTSKEDELPNMGLRVPVSIGECHEELSKSGEPCKAYDVAVSSNFFERTQNSRLYLRFMLQLAIESTANKFGLELDVDKYTVLKNRKTMGRLQRHRIEQRPPKGPLIQEIGGSASSSLSSAKSSSSAAGAAAPVASAAAPAVAGPAVAAAASTKGEGGAGPRAPERCRMVRRDAPDSSSRSLFVAELAMADVASASEVSFRAGEDRVVVESQRRGYTWDVFLPVRLDPDAARATFVREDRILNIQIPIIG